MRSAVNITALCGIVSVSMHLISSIISVHFADNYIQFYIIDMLSTILATLVPGLAFAYMGKGIRYYLVSHHKRKTKPLDSILLIFFGLSGCVIANMITTLLSSVLPESEPAVNLTFSGSFGNFLLMLTASAALPAVCEEITCRGYLYSSLSRFGHLYTILFSSFIFGMLHSNFNTAVFAFLCGFLFGCIRKTSNIFSLSIIVHFLNNALSTVSLFIRMNLGSSAYSVFFRISTQAALFIFVGVWFLLRKRGVRIFYFRKCPYPLRIRDKLIATFTSPVFWLFIAASTAVKLI